MKKIILSLLLFSSVCFASGGGPIGGGGGGGAVSSVFGRTGNVTAQSTDYSSYFLQITNNLSDLSSASTARTNLGLGTAATQPISSFLQPSNNLSDILSASTARTNLGLGTAATQNSTAFEPAITAGTTSQYWRGDKTFQTLNTTAVPEGTNLYFTNARAIASTLTGYVSGAGTISASDSILSSIQKLNGNIAALISGVSSVSNSDGTLTISPNSGAVVASRAAITGDVSVPAGSNTSTLATVNANVGSFGSASSVATHTVNAKGLVTAAASVPIQIAESQVTNLTSDLAGKQPTGNYVTSLTGDVTGSGPGATATTLATVNSNVGSFGTASSVPTITVNAKGLTTAAANTSIQISQSQVTGLTGTYLPLAGGTMSGVLNMGANNINNVSQVGVGTSSPTTNFQVIDTSTSVPRGILNSEYTNSTSSALLSMQKARGTLGSPSTIVTGDLIGRILNQGYDGTSFLLSGGIAVTSEGTVATTSIPTNMTFMTANQAVPSVQTEAMRINSLQQVSIGATTAGSMFNVGTSNQLQVTSAGLMSLPSFTVNGTAGAGYGLFNTQSSNPSTPASGFSLFANSTGMYSWIRASDGFVRTLDGTITASRTYSLPDATGTVALTSTSLQDANNLSDLTNAGTARTNLGLTSMSTTNTASTLVERDTSGNYNSQGVPSTQITTVTNAASPYTVASGDYLLLVNTSSGAVTINLPNPNTQRKIKIKDINGTFGTNNLTLARFGSEKIEGVTASLVLSANSGNYEFQSDGTNWWKVSTANNMATTTFTSSGSWTAPAGIYQVILSGRGGSGGGGGGASGSGGSTATAGGGGGGGASGGSTCSETILVTVAPNTAYTVTIGSAGSAGPGATAAAASSSGSTGVIGTGGGSGGNTLFGTLARFVGGTGGGGGLASGTFSNGGGGGTVASNSFGGTGYPGASGGGSNAAGGLASPTGVSISPFSSIGRTNGNSGGAAGGTSGGGGGGGGGGVTGGDFGATTGTAPTPGAGGAAGAIGGTGSTGSSGTGGTGGWGGTGGGGGGLLAATGTQGGNGVAGVAGNAGQLIIQWQE